MQSFDSSRRAQCLLTNMFGIPAGAPDLTWLEIPTRTNSKPLHQFLLPHEFFSSYFHNRHNSCCPTQRSPRRHGNRSSLLACAATLARSLTRTVCARSAGTPVFTVFRKSEMTEGTLNAVFEILAWSVNALLKGTFPQEHWHVAQMDEGSFQAAGAELFAKFGSTGPLTRKSSSSHNGTVHSACVSFAVPARRLGNFSGQTQARRGLAPDSVDPRGILGLFAWRGLSDSSALSCLHWISVGVCHGGRPANGGPRSRLTHARCRQCVLVVCRCAKVIWRRNPGHVDEVAVCAHAKLVQESQAVLEVARQVHGRQSKEKRWLA